MFKLTNESLRFVYNKGEKMAKRRKKAKKKKLKEEKEEEDSFAFKNAFLFLKRAFFLFYCFRNLNPT